MPKKSLIAVVIVAWAAAHAAAAEPQSGTREFRAGAGGKLTLDLRSGGSVKVSGTGGSSVTVTYKLACAPACTIDFDQSGSDVTVKTRFAEGTQHQSADVDLDIRVPSRFDVALDSMGGGLEIDGVKGTFQGETKGGELILHDVDGDAKLKTMGGEIRVTDSTLDGSLHTMGGAVTIENVVGDVKGSSMGGDVRYKNVRRKDGSPASPSRGDGSASAADVTPDTVQISTMGGAIHTEDAPEGADVMTMGGDIEIKNARRFVRAKTMGGDIAVDSADGWVSATTMGGNIDVTVTGSGGDVTLTSMSGNVVLHVPPGFGMKLDLEVAFTKNSRKEYSITAPGRDPQTVSPDWDYGQGSPRKYIRKSGSVNGGSHAVTVKTVNGDITVSEGR
jgi:DUF4097 and DUF4098 domain-containing protein YvlB